VAKGSILQIVGLSLALCSYGNAAADAQDCFSRSDNRRLKFDVFHISKPPVHNPGLKEEDQRSPYFPGTDYATSTPADPQRPAVSPNGAAPAMRRHYLLWANRCIFMPGITKNPEECRNTRSPKANSYPGIIGDARPLSEQVRAAFSTYAGANACTLIQAGAAIGKEWNQLKSWGTAAGIAVEKSTAGKEALNSHVRSVRLADGKTSTYLLDVCVVDQTLMSPDTQGIALDYEVFDNRTPREVVGFFSKLSGLLHEGHKTLVVTTNPLPRPPNGLDATNVVDVLNTVDGLATAISSGATAGNPNISSQPRARTMSPIDDYHRQLKVLTDNGRRQLTREQARKIVWTVSLYDTSLQEGKFLHDEIVARGYRGILLFRHYVKQGGACSRESNQLTACLAFGECTGRFGATR